MSETSAGCYLAYHEDWSGFAVFADELEAYRYAVENRMQVMWCPWGEDPREYLRD